MISISESAKESLRDGLNKIEYVIQYDFDEDMPRVLQNQDLIKDSVVFDERMCSESSIKFGLCEASSFEFQYYDSSGSIGNLRGRRIYVQMGVGISEYVPIGWFDVDKCSYNQATGIYKATAYNKIKSSSLDEDISPQLRELIGDGENGVAGTASVRYILDTLLGNKAIKPVEFSTSSVSRYTGSTSYNIDICTRLNSEHKAINTYVNAYVISASLKPDDGNFDPDEYYRIEVDPSLADSYFSSIYGMDDFDYIDGYSSVGTQFSRWWSSLHDAQGNQSINQVSIYHTGEVSASFRYKYVKDRTSETYVSDWHTNVTSMSIVVPVIFRLSSTAKQNITDSDMAAMDAAFTSWFASNKSKLRISKRTLSDAEKLKLTSSTVEDIGKVTLREIQDAVFELEGAFGKLNRLTDEFEGYQLSGTHLYPSEGRRPGESEYPYGAVEHLDRFSYKTLYADDETLNRYSTLTATYKTVVDDEVVEDTYSVTIREDGNVEYVCDDNWLLKNLTWDYDTLTDFVGKMALNLSLVRWIPFEMDAPGLPYLETGDLIEITTDKGTFPTYILRRELRGEGDLRDTLANGDVEVF